MYNQLETIIEDQCVHWASTWHNKLFEQVNFRRGMRSLGFHVIEAISTGQDQTLQPLGTCRKCINIIWLILRNKRMIYLAFTKATNAKYKIN